MPSSYTAVKEIAREKPEWIAVVQACYEVAGKTEEFAGAWVLKRLGHWVPSLRTLASRGILQKTDTSRGGRRAYYCMPNREGVGRALEELSASRTV